jgi:drug/metabolite transporter (DMT)-like permease
MRQTYRPRYGSKKRFFRILWRIDLLQGWYLNALLIALPGLIVLLYADDRRPMRGDVYVGFGFVLVAWAAVVCVYAYALYREAEAELMRDEAGEGRAKQ